MPIQEKFFLKFLKITRVGWMGVEVVIFYKFEPPKMRHIEISSWEESQLRRTFQNVPLGLVDEVGLSPQYTSEGRET